MRWNRISGLIDKIQEDLVYQGSVVAAQVPIRFVTFLQVFPPRRDPAYSRSFAARNCSNELYGQPRPNKCRASRSGKVDPKPSALGIGHYTPQWIH